MIGPTYAEIKPYIEKKLVSEQVNPINPDLRIFNYTQTCQFTREWDDVTRACRGLIMNVKTEEIIARPFPKFFNYGEYEGEIPDEAPEIMKKYDGSIGILYWINDVPFIATRGSFTSDQSRWASEFIRPRIMGDVTKAMVPVQLDRKATYLFEIIYPENRIVVSYDFSGMVLLAARDTASGMEYKHEYLKEMANSLGIACGELVETDDWKTLNEMNTPNEEGFVIHWSNGLRLKIKFDEYVRLHRIVTGISEKSIWEILSQNEPAVAEQKLKEVVEMVPDEFFNWFSGVVRRLRTEFERIADDYSAEFIKIQHELHEDEPVPERRKWALRIQQMNYPAIGFALLDGKDYSPIIWKMLKPKGQTQVFKEDIDQ